jgi:hypothetical protein
MSFVSVQVILVTSTTKNDLSIFSLFDIPTVGAEPRRSHDGSNNMNNRYTDGYSMGPVYQHRRDFVNSGGRTCMHYSLNQHEHFGTNFRHSVHNRLNYESEDSSDSEQTTYQTHIPPPVVNHQPSAAIREPFAAAWERSKKGELQIWSLHISSFSRNSSSQFQPPYFRLR